MQAVLTPFLLALLGSYLVNPLISLFEHRGIRRKAVVTMFYVIFLGALAGSAAIVIPTASREIRELQTQWPEKIEAVKRLTAGLSEKIARKVPGGEKLVSFINEKMSTIGMEAAAILPNVASGILSAATLLFLVPFVAFFFLVDGPSILEHALNLCPGRHVEKVLHLFCSINESLGNYLRALFIESTIIAILAVSGMYFLEMEYAVTLGLLAGISGLIPYIGPFVIGAVSACLALVQFHAFAPALKVLLLFVGLRFVDDWFVQPYIMSRAAHLHPAVLLLALMIGGHFFGVLGLILAAPAACVLRVILGTLVEWYMSESGITKPPELSAEDKFILV